MVVLVTTYAIVSQSTDALSLLSSLISQFGVILR
jgi:hypothetical protein